MKMEVKAPRKQRGRPHSDVRDECFKITFVATTQADLRALACLYNFVVDGNIFVDGRGIGGRLASLIDGVSPPPTAGPDRPSLRKAASGRWGSENETPQPPTGPTPPAVTAARRSTRRRRPG